MLFIFCIIGLIISIRVIYFKLKRKPVDEEEEKIFYITLGCLFLFISLFAGAYYIGKQEYIINGALQIIMLLPLKVITSLSLC